MAPALRSLLGQTVNLGKTMCFWVRLPLSKSPLVYTLGGINLMNVSTQGLPYPRHQFIVAIRHSPTMAFTPVIIGVADVKNKSDEHKEPATLMLEAIELALDDAGTAQDQLKLQIDSIDVVRTWTWPYTDLPGLLAQRLGLETRPKWARYTDTHGGNQPAKLVDEAAGRIARGEAMVAVVTGGEALASCESSPSAGPDDCSN